MTTAVKCELPVARTPEEVGVSSEKMLEMCKAMEKTGYHGFMVIRHGKIAFQAFKKPYTATIPHAMYSVSKGLTVIAIGFAVNEGLLSLDDRVIDYFPVKCDEYMKKIRLRHLISLSAGREVFPLKNKAKNDWTEMFLKSKAVYEPGENFSYINENFHMALAMLRKVTGVSTVEYLTPRLFEPLGIEPPFWETDHHGVEAGGWGLILPAVDLAKIGLCFMNDGVYNGRQVIPKDWIAQATTNHKSPKARDQGAHNFGYGYGLWIRDNDNGPVRFDGLFGQIVEMYRDYDAIAVTVGGDIAGENRGVLFKYLPESFIDEQPNAPVNEELVRAADEPEFKVPYSEYRSPLESSINKKLISFRKKHILNKISFQVSVIPAAATYMSSKRAGNITDVRFNFGNDSMTFSWSEGDEKNSVECGLDGQWRVSDMRLAGVNYTTFAAAKWEDENTLMFQIRPHECFCARNLQFKFKGRKVEMTPTSDPPIDSILSGVRGLLNRYLNSDKMTDGILTWARNSLEPVHKGRIRK